MAHRTEFSRYRNVMKKSVHKLAQTDRIKCGNCLRGQIYGHTNPQLV